MNLFNLKNKSVESVEIKPFELEKEIQDLVENNTMPIFQLEFVYSEFTIGAYRIDTLCYDNENNSFVIIEYKKGKSYSVIDQGYTYLQLLLNNKSDFVLALSQHNNKVLRNEDIDWSQSKILFVSTSFNAYQKDSVNFKNLPFELWEIQRFTNNTLIFNRHKSTSKESIESLSNNNNSIISSVNKEVEVFDEEKLTSKTDKKIINKWEEFKLKFDELDNVEFVPHRHYMKLVYNNRVIAYCNFRKSYIFMDIIRGDVKPDGSTSKHFFTIDDPKGISEECTRNYKGGVKGHSYKIQLDKSTDIDYLFFLTKQKYNNLTSR